MKLRLILLTVLLASTAQAREWTHDANPREEAWQWLGVLSNEDDSMTTDGLHIQNLPALKSYARKSIKEMDEWARQQSEQLCKNRAKYEHDSEKLAQWYEKRDADEAKFQQKAIDKLPEVIGETDATSFQNFIRHKVENNPATVGGMDNAEELRAGRNTPTALLNLWCAP